MAFVRAIGRLSRGLGIVAMAQIMCLMGAMVFEVVCRFGFNAPNLWSLDIAYMLAGSLFFVGAAHTLQAKAHVKIDFLSHRFPPGLEFYIQSLFAALLFLPIVGIVVVSVFGKAWHAYATQQTDYTSPWAPLMWPFYTAIGIGISALWLQALAELVERVIGRFHGARPDPGRGSPAKDPAPPK